MTIKHIVISGGGPAGLISYGSLRKLHNHGLWKLDDIESIYASSSGSLIAVIIALGYEWNILDDYFVDRPWDVAFADINTGIIDIICSKGLDGIKLNKVCTDSLFKCKNLSENITLKELFEYTHINICLTATDINANYTLTGEILSHTTYPDMPVVQAVASSCALPLVFKPVFVNNRCFIDGGLIHNYPLQLCIDNTGCNMDDILAIHNTKRSATPNHINESSTFMEYVLQLIRKGHTTIDSTKVQPIIKHTVMSGSNVFNISYWLDAIYKREFRIELIEQGVSDADILIKEMTRGTAVECQHRV